MVPTAAPMTKTCAIFAFPAHFDAPVPPTLHTPGAAVRVASPSRRTPSIHNGFCADSENLATRARALGKSPAQPSSLPNMDPGV